MAVLMSDGRIAEPPEPGGVALFRLAFRPFFLFAALFSVVAMLLWSGLVSGVVTPGFWLVFRPLSADPGERSSGRSARLVCLVCCHLNLWCRHVERSDCLMK